MIDGLSVARDSPVRAAHDRRVKVPGRAQIHLGPPGGVKEVGAQFLDRFASYIPLMALI